MSRIGKLPITIPAGVTITVSDDNTVTVTKIYPGTNVGMGKDHTLFALIDGTVKYERLGKDKKKVSVYAK